MNREIDFLRDLKEESIDTLKQFGVKYHAEENANELLVRLFVFKLRYISEKPRTVLVSNELKEKLPTLPQRIICACNKMEKWVREGVNVNSFQSGSLYGSGGDRDYQNCLYGAVHLHLSAQEEDEFPVVKKNRFSKRSNYVLIALFTDDIAYFIDVVEHPKLEDPAWTSKEILQIMVNNWPKLVEPYFIPGAKLTLDDGTEVELDDAALAMATRNGITTAISVKNGIAFPPNGGVTSDGTSSKAVSDADQICNEAQAVQKEYIKHKKQLRRKAKEILIMHKIPVPRKSDVHFEYAEELGRYMVFDRTFKVGWDYQKQELLLFPKYSIEQVREKAGI